MHMLNKDVCETLMPPFPNIWRISLTFDLDIWPTDLNINRNHLLIKVYLPTKFEAFWTKRSWIIRCTRFGRLTWLLTLTFDQLTWISIGIIYWLRTIYLPSLKPLGQSVLELSVTQGLEDWHDLWPWPFTYWLECQKESSSHQGLSTYQVWRFWGKTFLSYQLHKVKGYRHTDRPTYRPTCAPQYVALPIEDREQILTKSILARVCTLNVCG